ncbi:hypothetical protein GCM10012275_52260 [Longimycelium tulufanense]|uniref:DUF3592 domain-containing protein n=1 Tax=Longimycelium tulufanense TaxID=907463 RepID=A0A8J3CJB0_9PSEU|nr:DUF6346 domain-containing protein [Longimycelium tulufanense]GGM75117.1 hypothetical protein GCM10012275_52260 [Longimycelium tulufanense]
MRYLFLAGRALRMVLGLCLALLVLLLGFTLSTWAGETASNGKRGSATVESCESEGPVSTQGLGYWRRCQVSVAWQDGTRSEHSVSSGQGFHDAPVGSAIEVRYARKTSSLDRYVIQAEGPSWFREVIVGKGLGLIGGFVGAGITALFALVQLVPKHRRPSFRKLWREAEEEEKRKEAEGKARVAQAPPVPWRQPEQPGQEKPDRRS